MLEGMTGDDDNKAGSKIDARIEKVLEKLDEKIDAEKIDAFIDAYEKKFEAFEKKMMEPEKPRFLSNNKRIVIFLVLLYMGAFYLMTEHETGAQKLASLTSGALLVLVFVFIGWVALKFIGDGKGPKPPA